MSITLTLDLNDHDLEHFQRAMEATHRANAGKSPQEVIACASKLLSEAQKTEVPQFIKHRLVQLDNMIAMVSDEGFVLPDVDRQRVLAALTYFCDPQDLITDDVAVLGLLDDAIMIELAARQLSHELDAYEDFCDYRQREADKRSMNPATVGRAEWLDGRRTELIERMHQRRERDFGTGYGGSSGYSGGARSYSGGWRPSLFKFN